MHADTHCLTNSLTQPIHQEYPPLVESASTASEVVLAPAPPSRSQKKRLSMHFNKSRLANALTPLPSTQPPTSVEKPASETAASEVGVCAGYLLTDSHTRAFAHTLSHTHTLHSIRDGHLSVRAYPRRRHCLPPFHPTVKTTTRCIFSTHKSQALHPCRRRRHPHQSRSQPVRLLQARLVYVLVICSLIHARRHSLPD